VLRDPQIPLDLDQPRTIGQILLTGLQVYSRWALLFIFLAGIVVVPYEVVIVLLAHRKTVSTATELIVGLIGTALVGPCIAAVQVQALLDLADGLRPELRSIFQRGLSVLPVVAAAEIVVGLSEAAGVFLFVIPGIIVAVRWAVAGQVAAVERTDWPTAIRRSIELTRYNFWRVLGLLLIAGILTELVAALIEAGTGGLTIVGVVLAIVSFSFTTLLTNLLYFDLRARESTRVA